MLDPSTIRFVIIVDKELPPGLAANTAAVLALNVGRAHPDAVGPDVADGSGVVHPGLTGLPLPVLGGDKDALPVLAERARQEGLDVVGFSDLAQACRNYGEYQEKLAASRTCDLGWRGILLMGEPKAVTRLTSSIGLYR